MGAGPASEVEVRLAPGDGAETVLELEHTAVVDPGFWATYGPGSVGVGWDLALLGLFLYLSTGTDRPDDPAAWRQRCHRARRNLDAIATLGDDGGPGR